jgi:hypothetical protein
MKYKSKIIIGVFILVIIIVITFFLSYNTDNSNNYQKIKIMGSWKDDLNGDIWTFYENDILTITNRSFEFDYWFDNNDFCYSIKDDDWVYPKFTITLENDEKTLILERIGTSIGGNFQYDPEDNKKTYHLTRL